MVYLAFCTAHMSYYNFKKTLVSKVDKFKKFFFLFSLCTNKLCITKRGRNVIIPPPTVSTVNLLFFFLIHKLVCNAPVFFYPHRTVMNRGWAVGFFFSDILCAHPRAAFQTLIFNILNGLTGISRRSINGSAKQAIYRSQILLFTYTVIWPALDNAAAVPGGTRLVTTHSSPLPPPNDPILLTTVPQTVLHGSQFLQTKNYLY